MFKKKLGAPTGTSSPSVAPIGAGGASVPTRPIARNAAFFDASSAYCAKHVGGPPTRTVEILTTGADLTKFDLNTVRDVLRQAHHSLQRGGLIFPQMRDREDIVRIAPGLGWHYDQPGYRGAYVLGKDGSFLAREQLLEAHEDEFRNRLAMRVEVQLCGLLGKFDLEQHLRPETARFLLRSHEPLAEQKLCT